MKTLQQIQDETTTMFKGRAIFTGIDQEALAQNISEIANFASLLTAEAIKGAILKKKIVVKDIRDLTETELGDFFAEIIATHDVTSIDQLGSGKFAVTVLEHAPDIS